MRNRGAQVAARSLYRSLLRKIRLLPEETRSYYAAYARENFVSFSDEDEPQRIRELQQLAERHAAWVLRKYGKIRTEREE